MKLMSITNRIQRITYFSDYISAIVGYVFGSLLVSLAYVHTLYTGYFFGGCLLYLGWKCLTKYFNQTPKRNIKTDNGRIIYCYSGILLSHLMIILSISVIFISIICGEITHNNILKYFGYLCVFLYSIRLFSRSTIVLRELNLK